MLLLVQSIYWHLQSLFRKVSGPEGHSFLWHKIVFLGRMSSAWKAFNIMFHQSRLSYRCPVKSSSVSLIFIQRRRRRNQEIWFDASRCLDLTSANGKVVETLKRVYHLQHLSSLWRLLKLCTNVKKIRMKWAKNARCQNFQMYVLNPSMLYIYWLKLICYLHFVFKSGRIQAME